MVWARRERYDALKGWLASPAGRSGLARLEAMGLVWKRGGNAGDLTDALSALDCAPSLPPVHTFRDKAAFACGVCWTLAYVKARASAQEVRSPS